MKLLLVVILFGLLVAVLADLEDRAPKKGSNGQGNGHGKGQGKGNGKKSRKEKFSDFAKKHRRKYKNAAEEERRMKLYNVTMDRIDKHNEEAQKGMHSYTMAENHLSDREPEEVKRLMGVIPPPADNRSRDSHFELDLRQSTPESVDLRNDSCMPPIKNQGGCGSCWAFATVTPLEYQNCRKSSSMTLLSEQQLVSCSGQACRGGFYLTAYNYIKRAGGIVSGETYPYNATESNCSYSANDAVVKVASAGWVRPYNNEKAIERAVAEKGPVAVSIHANQNFYSYHSGIFDDSNCPTAVNHAVVVVGYGTSYSGDPQLRQSNNGASQTSGIDYWIVRNTWGPEWGENGYFRMKRGVNLCGIAKYAVWVSIA